MGQGGKLSTIDAREVREEEDYEVDEAESEDESDTPAPSTPAMAPGQTVRVPMWRRLSRLLLKICGLLALAWFLIELGILVLMQYGIEPPNLMATISRGTFADFALASAVAFGSLIFIVYLAVRSYEKRLNAMLTPALASGFSARIETGALDASSGAVRAPAGQLGLTNGERTSDVSIRGGSEEVSHVSGGGAGEASPDETGDEERQVQSADAADEREPSRLRTIFNLGALSLTFYGLTVALTVVPFSDFLVSGSCAPNANDPSTGWKLYVLSSVLGIGLIFLIVGGPKLLDRFAAVTVATVLIASFMLLYYRVSVQLLPCIPSRFGGINL